MRLTRSMFGATSYSADYHIDYVYCEANGIARADCQENQVNTYVASNPNLGPEESESMNFGVIYDFELFGNHSVALDIFETTVTGIITSITVQDIIDATILGKADQLTSGSICTRTGSANGPLEECRNPSMVMIFLLVVLISNGKEHLTLQLGMLIQVCLYTNDKK